MTEGKLWQKYLKISHTFQKITQPWNMILPLIHTTSVIISGSCAVYMKVIKSLHGLSNPLKLNLIISICYLLTFCWFRCFIKFDWISGISNFTIHKRKCSENISIMANDPDIKCILVFGLKINLFFFRTYLSLLRSILMSTLKTFPLNYG